MATDHGESNLIDGVPERFVPTTMAGSLEEAEHLARYSFAQGLVTEGARVLDAGCGTAYGTNILARGGAAAVVGVDVAESVLVSARGDADDNVELRVANVEELPFGDASFDLVVCFEVIEHIEGRDRAIDEFRRVLAPGGVLVLSSPNRDEYVPGNPHHVFEYRPEELRDALAARFGWVTLRRQHGWVISAVLDDAEFAQDDTGRPVDLAVHKAVGRKPGTETYTVAIASDGPVEPPSAIGVATTTVEVSRWVELFAAQQGVLDDQRLLLERLVAEQDERSQLRIALERADLEVGELREAVHERERRLEALELRLTRAEQRRDVLVADLEHAEMRLERADRVLAAVQSSPSWRATAPLRLAKRFLRG